MRTNIWLSGKGEKKFLKNQEEYYKSQLAEQRRQRELEEDRLDYEREQAEEERQAEMFRNNPDAFFKLKQMEKDEKDQHMKLAMRASMIAGAILLVMCLFATCLGK